MRLTLCFPSSCGEPLLSSHPTGFPCFSVSFAFVHCLSQVDALDIATRPPANAPPQRRLSILRRAHTPSHHRSRFRAHEALVVRKSPRSGSSTGARVGLAGIVGHSSERGMVHLFVADALR